MVLSFQVRPHDDSDRGRWNRTSLGLMACAGPTVHDMLQFRGRVLVVDGERPPNCLANFIEWSVGVQTGVRSSSGLRSKLL